jgi:gamma-glutamyltranspeptidase / glutathione hydrolase / leukotriene-C4 hydrolase
MKIISVKGAEAIYNGSLTHQLVEDIKKANGIITEEDMANYELVTIIYII